MTFSAFLFPLQCRICHLNHDTSAVKRQVVATEYNSATMITQEMKRLMVCYVRIYGEFFIVDNSVRD